MFLVVLLADSVRTCSRHSVEYGTQAHIYVRKAPRGKPRGDMATLTGLEPATSAVTGRRANQLRHRALFICFCTVARVDTLHRLRDKPQISR